MRRRERKQPRSKVKKAQPERRVRHHPEEEGTARKKIKTPPRRRVRHSPEKGIGTARGTGSDHAEKERMKKKSNDA